jgi:hypothetical protein
LFALSVTYGTSFIIHQQISGVALNDGLVFSIGSFALGLLGLAYQMGANSSKSIACMITPYYTKLQPGAFIALELRNKFGFVGEDGNLLRFSPEDSLKYDANFFGGYTFNCDAHTKLVTKEIESEVDLITFVVKWNVWLKSKNLSMIPVSYPLQVKQIIMHLEKSVFPHCSFDKEYISKTLEKFKGLEYKIVVCRELWAASREISAWCFQPRPATLIVNKAAYYKVFETINLELRDGKLSKLCSEYEDRLSKFVAPQPEHTVFNNFHWELLNKNPKGEEAHNYLNLPQNFSESEMKKMFYKYSRALHPDKNKENQELATELFCAFGKIKEMIEDQLRAPT